MKDKKCIYHLKIKRCLIDTEVKAVCLCIGSSGPLIIFLKLHLVNLLVSVYDSISTLIGAIFCTLLMMMDVELELRTIFFLVLSSVVSVNHKEIIKMQFTMQSMAYWFNKVRQNICFSILR